MVPSLSKHSVGICKQITLLILCYISSMLVTLLQVIVDPLQAPNIFHFTISFKFLNLAFSYSLFLFLKCLLTSRLTLFKLPTLLWLESCIHCILAWFLWSKIPKHSWSNHGLCYFNSCRPRLYLDVVLIFSLIFSQALFISSPSLNFFNAANLFVISIWYFFLTSSSFSFLKLNLPHQTSVLLIYLLQIFS